MGVDSQETYTASPSQPCGKCEVFMLCDVDVTLLVHPRC